jgi:hypothetical protein
MSFLNRPVNWKKAWKENFFNRDARSIHITSHSGIDIESETEYFVVGKNQWPFSIQEVFLCLFSESWNILHP